MKILFFMNGLFIGGKERRLIELLKELKNNPEIEFELVLMEETICYKEVFDLGIKINYFIRKTKKDLSVFKSLYRYCKEYKPDIIHCWDSMTAFYSAPVCKLLNIKLVNGMVNNAPAKNSIYNQAYLIGKLTFPFSYAVVGNSYAGLNAYKAPKRKSICIYNGFNFKRLGGIQQVDIIKDQLKITTKYSVGMVASFSEFKDYKTYFLAASMILKKRNDITFFAVGDNTDSEASKVLVPQECHQQIRLLGERSDIESLVSVFDVGVLSTFTEGISNSILEYMALSKPVVATIGGGTTEIVDNRSTGFLVKPSDPVALAEKIEFLINNEPLRKKMGAAGKARVTDLFSIKKMVDSYIDIYKAIKMKKTANEK